MKFSLWPDSIKARVTLSALGVFLLSLWVLAFLTTQVLERDISQLVADAQASATSQMAAQLDRELGSRLTALERIAAGINADMIENPDAVQHLLEAQPLLQDLFNVSVLALDKNGISIADYPYMVERIGVDYRVRVAAFAVALDEGRANIGNPLMAPTIGVPLIPLAVPIRDGSGEVIGALGGAIDLSKPNFFDDLTAQAYGRTGDYLLISKSQRLIVTSSNPDLIMAELPQPGVRPVLDRALRGEEGSERYTTTQGIDSLATVQGLDVTDWLIATITPISEAYRPIKDMQRRMILVVLAVTPLVGIIIWWLLQRQLRPILTTVDTLGQMTETLRPAQSLKLTGRKEVDNLIGSFNRLLHVVAEREQKLQASEDALRRQNVLFNVMLDNLAIGVFMVEAPSGKPLIVNQAAQNLLGRGILPEASGENLSDVYRAEKVGSGESYPLTEMPIILGMSGHVSHVDDMLVERPDATKIQLEVFGTPVRNDNGEVWASLVSFYDITERKQVEESLRESAMTFKKLFDDSSDAILLIDSTGVFVECNQAALNLLKMSRREFINRPPVMISPEFQPNGRRSSEAAQDMIEQAYAKGLHRFDWTCVNSEGSEFIVAVSLMPIIINGQTMLHTTWRDITERKRAEKKLQASEEMFRNIVHASPMGIHLYQLEEVGRLIFIGSNPAADRLLRTDNSAFIGLTIEEAFPPLVDSEVPERYRRAARDGESWYTEQVNYNDGRLSGLFEVIAFQMSPGKVAVLFNDITEKKQAEEEKEKLQAQLTQAQKMESVGRLAGGVAHDFNNMLGVILGYTQLAMRKIAPDAPLYANLDEIRKAAERSADLTRQLLAFARQQTVAPKVLDLNETVNDMLNMLRRLIGEDMDLAWRPGSNLRSVFIDPSQVDQILTNLCVNARDAIADTGKITIETASVSFDEAYCADHAGFVPGEFVMLAVSDDGCGMDAETLSHLFEPFFSTKEMGKGTGMGLGLATVYGIAKQNNGFINVYSEPGHGTIFKIYLPQHAAKAAPRSEQEQAPSAVTDGEIILLVEDEPAILEVSTIMLEEMGYAVIAAGSPGEAIRLAREHHGRIDLLMTDVVMPEMNGRDLAGNLMSIYPDIRCLFMSGYTANVIAHHGVLDPGVHFLQKPFSMQDMAAKIREALDHKEPNREND